MDIDAALVSVCHVIRACLRARKLSPLWSSVAALRTNLEFGIHRLAVWGSDRGARRWRTGHWTSDIMKTQLRLSSPVPFNVWPGQNQMGLSPDVWSEKCRYCLRPVLSSACCIESSSKLGILQGIHAKLARASNPPKLHNSDRFSIWCWFWPRQAIGPNWFAWFCWLQQLPSSPILSHSYLTTDGLLRDSRINNW